MKSLWVDPSVLQWQSHSGGGSEPEARIYLRAYEIWNHAEKVLSNANSDLHLVDVITSLKRSIDQRTRALNRIYSFATIPIKNKPSEVLSLLEFLGIVRPLMFRSLSEIRNAVEHEDASPPDLKGTQVFLEFAWYFLKSTDRLLQLVSDSVGFSAPDQENDHYWLEVNYGPENQWNPLMRGWVGSAMISHDPVPDWIVLALKRLDTYELLRKRLRETGNVNSLKHHSERRKRPDDIYIDGSLRGSENAILRLTKIYFSTV